MFLSDERQKEIEKANLQIEEKHEAGKDVQDLEFKKEKLEQGMAAAQYNDFFSDEKKLCK